MNNQDYIYYASNPKIMRLVFEFHTQLTALIEEMKEQEKIQQELARQILEDEIIKQAHAESQSCSLSRFNQAALEEFNRQFPGDNDKGKDKDDEVL